MFESTSLKKKARVCAVGILAGLMVACGGGGGDGCNSLDPTRNLSLPSCAPRTPSGTTAAGSSTALTVDSFKLTLVDGSGATITSVSPDRSGLLKAVVKDSKGNAAPNIAVTFTTTDKTGVFVPSSGTALTDVSGVAQVSLPTGAQAGAFTATATANVGTSTVSGKISYAVSFPTLAFSALMATPANLSAGSTATLGVTVLNGSSPFIPAQSVSFTSPCATVGKATISSPVITVNGVASTSYTDKGCGGPDTITASTSLGGATFTQTGTISVQSAVAGQISFVSALPQNISLKGTGGAGRQESSVVTFKVLDKNGNPVSGKTVNFTLTTEAGGLSLNPASSTTGADGRASTVVVAGTINTPVRVMANLTGTSMTTLSDQLVISTGIPDQNSFSLSTEIFNVEGMNYDGCEGPVGSKVRVSLADHFNNPVPDGTAVSFTAEGGTVDASCLTGLTETTLTDGTVITQKGVPGQCTVRFCSANPRSEDGRITILAYALGEESFIDTNGNNLFDEPNGIFQDLGEPFRNDRAITDRNANANWGIKANLIDVINPDDQWSTGNANRALGETFIDTNFSNDWTEKGDAFYNGVLKVPQNFNYQATHVRRALVQVLSGSEPKITVVDTTPPLPTILSQCNGAQSLNTQITIRVAVRDQNRTIFSNNRANIAPLYLPKDLSGNILPAGTLIAFFDPPYGDDVPPIAKFIVPNTNEPSAAVWIYAVPIPSYVCGRPLRVTVKTPRGITTTKLISLTDTD